MDLRGETFWMVRYFDYDTCDLRMNFFSTEEAATSYAEKTYSAHEIAHYIYFEECVIEG